MLKNITTLCVVLVAMFASKGFASDAGCGLGSLVITKNSKVSQFLAMTTNASLSTQVFGITSGTSGCSASGIVSNKAEAIKYAEANFENLKVDIARGEGESLYSIASLLGCRGRAVMEFSKVSQKNFSEIVPENAAPAQVIDALDQKIKSDQKLIECMPAV